MDTPAHLVRRTLWGAAAAACVACVALAAAGLFAWAAGAAVGSAVALGNFWLLARAILRLDPGAEPAQSPGARGAGRLRATIQGAALRLILAGAALGLALRYLPIHPLGIVVGLVGVHAAMAVIWTTASFSGIEP